VKLWRLPLFLVTVLWDVLRANVEVAQVVTRAIVRPEQAGVHPAIIAVPTDLRGGRLVLLANITTLTPGTISVDISDGEDVLYVHALDAPDPDALIADSRELERRIREVFGP
jgi:multisubunit Na+/H+ antiporter MnhE subunit